jgi:hypothetical protein
MPPHRRYVSRRVCRVKRILPPAILATHLAQLDVGEDVPSSLMHHRRRKKTSSSDDSRGRLVPNTDRLLPICKTSTTTYRPGNRNARAIYVGTRPTRRVDLRARGNTVLVERYVDVDRAAIDVSAVIEVIRHWHEAYVGTTAAAIVHIETTSAYDGTRHMPTRSTRHRYWMPTK